MLAAEEDGPGDAAGVLSLQEQRLGLAVLEAEDLAVTADKDLTLLEKSIVSHHIRHLCACIVPMCCRLKIANREVECRSRGSSQKFQRHSDRRRESNEASAKP